MELQHLLRLVSAAHADEDSESPEERSHVKVLSACKTDFVQALMRLKSKIELMLGEVDSAQVEERGGVIRVGCQHLFEFLFCGFIAKLAFIKDAQVVIDRNEIWRHLLRCGQGGERLVQIIRLRVCESDIKIVRGHCMAGLYDFLELGDGLGVLSLLIIGLPEVAPSLERSSTRRCRMGSGGRSARLRRRALLFQ